MKFIYKLPRLVIFFGSLIYAGLNFFISMLWAGSYGLFGAANSQKEQIVGSIMAIIAISIAVSAFFIFKRNIFVPFMILMSLAIIGFLAFVSIQGFGNEMDLFFAIYIIGLVALFKISKLLESKLSS